MTFIVDTDFAKSASYLDNKRLGKQRVEAQQILDILLGTTGSNSTAWQKHPIVLSWQGYENALKYYINCIIDEWESRGYQNNMSKHVVVEPVVLPWWAEWSFLHQSHRAMLCRKEPMHYVNLFVGDMAIHPEFYKYGYIWPNRMLYQYVYYHKFLTVYHLPFITDVIPKELQRPRYCSAVLRSGKNAGQYCYAIIKKDNKPFCGKHC